MSAITSAISDGGSQPTLGQQIQETARATVRDWSEVCQKAIDVAKQQLLESDPSPEFVQSIQTAFKLLLRTSRVMHALASDPDYKDRSLADELEGRVLQLEHLWLEISNPMSEAEADRILNQVFPDER